MTVIAVVVFNVVRYYMVDTNRLIHPSLERFLLSEGTLKGELLMPLLMMVVYYLSGAYDRVLLRSRLRELINTVVCAFVGSLVFFFAAILNDISYSKLLNYEIFLVFMLVLIAFVYPPRLILTNRTNRRIRRGRLAFNTLVVGTSDAARKVAADLAGRYRGMGLKVVGFVSTDADGRSTDSIDSLPVYDFEDIEYVVETGDIRNIIVMPHSDGRQATIEIINRLFPLDRSILITPDLYGLMMVQPRLNSVGQMPLIDISRTEMPLSTLNIKRLSDVVISSLSLVVLSPLMAAIALAVKLDSRGPVFYRQERVGYHKRKFNILKFRTMRIDAESSGPQLSSENDSRITRVGHYLRKYRLDELPNFWNVLLGEMSIVGPRPEREFYIRQIIERAPYYTLVHQVRPGITSWGMVQYGYAKSVDDMVERLSYDLIYLENVSFFVDMKILIYTIKTVVTGRGM